jgi:hypothetical protein
MTHGRPRADLCDMQVGQFPASAATALIDGYCDDFVSLASILAQTLEQVSIRGIKLDRSRESLERIERGMREMSEAIKELLERGQVTTDFEVTLGREKKEKDPPPVPSPAPAPATAPPKAAAPSTAPTPTAGPARMAPMPGSSPARPDNGAPSAASRPAVSRPSTTPKAPVPSAATPRPRPPSPPPAKASAPNARPPAPAIPSATPFRSLLESLEQERRNGTLYVQAGQETLAFELVDGCITQTASDGIVADERLGDLLIEAGHCTREKLASVLSRLRPDEKHLIGEVLVREGMVANRHVIEALEKQVQRRLRRACTTANARFDFADGELMPDDGRVRVSPSAMLRSLQEPRQG